MSELPLSHIRVIDLSRVRAGPNCTKFFADFGADVIKVEQVDGRGDPMADNRYSSDYVNSNRNKRGITLDLKKPEGIAILKRLVEKADVLVENFRPDVKHRLGIDYEAMAAVNPRLVYTSISAFGETGPYAHRPGFDLIAQGMGGLMWLTGYEGSGPLRVGISPADLSAGIFASMGTMIALLERERSGRGQWVKTSLLASQIMLLDYQAMQWLMDKKIPKQRGNDHQRCEFRINETVGDATGQAQALRGVNGRLGFFVGHYWTSMRLPFRSTAPGLATSRSPFWSPASTSTSAPKGFPTAM